MALDETSAEAEFNATRAVYVALEPLDVLARERVVSHVSSMLGITKQNNTTTVGDIHLDDVAEINTTTPTVTHQTFAELFDAAQPQTTAHKALVAGYWLQACEGADSFDGQRANKELNHLGHKIANITNAIASLNGQKPSLAIQLKKSGSSQQARKTYKITAAGITAVKAMING